MELVKPLPMQSTVLLLVILKKQQQNTPQVFLTYQ